jgi:metallo-beta-lactamase class B
MKLFLCIIVFVISGTICPLNAQVNSIVIPIVKDLELIKLSDTAYIHRSYMTLPEFGKFGCNGFIYVVNKTCYIFDTPHNQDLSVALLNWIETEMQLKIKGVVVNHFHDDCLGGLEQFHARGIPSYSNILTQALAQARQVTIPQIGFEKKLSLKLDGKNITCTYFGEGHTKDNIVIYFPDEAIIFGGCLLKSLKSGKGNLADANVASWSHTVRQVKDAYPLVQTVIPGHGNHGDQSLLDYTIKMFENK